MNTDFHTELDPAQTARWTHACRGCACGFAPQRRRFAGALLASAAGLALPAWAREGVEVRPLSGLRKLVSEEQIEQSATAQYAQLQQAAVQKNELLPDDHPQVIRLRAIAQRIIPYTYEWNPRARDWKWEVNLLDSPQLNAFCMPGGKIAFYSGILEQLQLSDAEVALIMGHEATHALREHARGQMSKGAVTRGVVGLGAAILGLGNAGRMVADAGVQVVTLKFGRQDESEADLVGLELAARAGYNPQAGVTLWQKMAAAAKGAPPEFLSTHPSGPTRIKDIQANIPKVAGLYARADKPAQRFAPPARATTEQR